MSASTSTFFPLLSPHTPAIRGYCSFFQHVARTKWGVYLSWLKTPCLIRPYAGRRRRKTRKASNVRSRNLIRGWPWLWGPQLCLHSLNVTWRLPTINISCLCLYIFTHTFFFLFIGELCLGNVKVNFLVGARRLLWGDGMPRIGTRASACTGSIGLRSAAAREEKGHYPVWRGEKCLYYWRVCSLTVRGDGRGSEKQPERLRADA